MPDRLNPTELRERAREHRRAAERDVNPSTRKARLTLAEEYERLAAALESDVSVGTRRKP